MAKFEIIGHRGNGKGPDENTLVSCRAAIAGGATAVELDVRLVDGELVLAHAFRRPRERLGTILRGLSVPVVVHINRRHLNPRHDRRALRQLAGLQHRPGLTVSSWWPGTLRYAKRHHPKLRTAFITRWLGWDRHFAASLGVSEFHAWHRTLTRRAIGKTNLPVIAFVPNQPIRPAVAGVITDRPKRFARRRARRR